VRQARHLPATGEATFTSSSSGHAQLVALNVSSRLSITALRADDDRTAEHDRDAPARRRAAISAYPRPREIQIRRATMRPLQGASSSRHTMPPAGSWNVTASASACRISWSGVGARIGTLATGPVLAPIAASHATSSSDEVV
jgi:hypothetical protein